MRMGMHYGSRTADRLTDRQRDVLALIARGCTNGQIAERLGITLDGAKWHVSEIMAKLGASSREEAVAAWRAEQSLGARLSRATRWAGATLFTSQAAGVVAGVAAAVIVAAAVVVMVVANNGGDDSNPAAVTSPTPATTATPAASPSASASPAASSTAAPTPPPSVTVPGPVVTPAALSQLQMSDSTNGWAFDAGSGGSHYTLRTGDGGRTWHNVSPLPDQDKSINQAFFLDRDHAWALVVQRASGTAEVQPRIFRTTDGGATWQASDPFASPIPQGTLSFADANNGWYFESQGAGAGSQGITIYRTTDGGATWAKMSETAGSIGSPGPNLPLSCIKSEPLLLTATTGFATASCAGGPPFLYRTTDAGKTWSLIALPDPTDPSKTLTACSCGMATPVFPTKNDGFVALSGEHQAIYVTHDAGQTWKPSGPLPGKAPSAIAFADASHGWLLDYPHLYTTTDAGSSWTDLGKPPFDNALMAFVSPTEGFAWARESAQGNTNTTGILHTIDAGKNWTPVK